MLDDKNPEEMLNDSYRNTIDGSADDKKEKEQEITDEEKKSEDTDLKEELDTNFPLSGGGTEPFFKNEGA
jgi:hypothetical protein